MSNRTDWENVAREIAELGYARMVTELHNAFVAGEESKDAGRWSAQQPSPDMMDGWMKLADSIDANIRVESISDVDVESIVTQAELAASGLRRLVAAVRGEAVAETKTVGATDGGGLTS